MGRSSHLAGPAEIDPGGLSTGAASACQIALAKTKTRHLTGHALENSRRLLLYAASE